MNMMMTIYDNILDDMYEQEPIYYSGIRQLTHFKICHDDVQSKLIRIINTII